MMCFVFISGVVANDVENHRVWRAGANESSDNEYYVLTRRQARFVTGHQFTRDILGSRRQLGPTKYTEPKTLYLHLELKIV